MFFRNFCLMTSMICAGLYAEPQTEVADAIAQGRLLQSQGHLVEAEQRFKEAVDASERLSMNPCATVAALSRLASAELDLSRLDTAVGLYNRAIIVLRKKPNTCDSSIETLRLQMADVFMEAGQIAKARGLIGPKDVRGQMRLDSNTALRLDVLAVLYAFQGKLAAAEKSERQSLAILAALGTVEDSAFAIGFLHLSSVLNLRKEPLQALPYAMRSLAIVQALPLAQPAMEALANATLASIYSRLGRNEEARCKAAEAYIEIRNHYGPNHPRTAMILFAQAAVLRTIGLKQAAQDAQHEAERIRAEGRSYGIDVIVPLESLLPRR
jgi:tetratricopeptide (TPR) repeat protein